MIRTLFLRASFVLGLLSIAAAHSEAQRPNIDFKRGDSVVVAIPLKLATVRLGGFLGISPRIEYFVGLADGGPVVHDSTGRAVPNWQAAGFPSSLHYAVQQVNTVRRPDRSQVVEVVLRNGAIATRVFAPVGQEAALQSFVAPLRQADSLRLAGYHALGELFFTGPLASYSQEDRVKILTWAHLTAGGSRIGSETYRGANYLVVDIPTDGSLWNDLVIKQPTRIGKILTDRFAMLKAFARLSIPNQSIGGVKLSTESCHGHAPTYTDKKCDTVEIYFPVVSLLKFADDEITSQQLVNESVVRVAGDRIEVNLSAQ